MTSSLRRQVEPLPSNGERREPGHALEEAPGEAAALRVSNKFGSNSRLAPSHGAHLSCTLDESHKHAQTMSTHSSTPTQTFMRPVFWARRPAAALSSTFAVTPWGKMLLWALALVGCMGMSVEADGVLAASKGAESAATLTPLHLTFHGSRLSAIHPSLLESTGEAAGESQSEPVAEGSTKKEKGLHKLKWPNAKKILVKPPSRSNSREAIESSEESEVETDAEHSPTAGDKKRKLRLGLKVAALGKKLRRRRPTPRDTETDNETSADPEKKSSLLKSFRSKAPKGQATENQHAPMGPIFDSYVLSGASEIGDEVVGSFSRSALSVAGKKEQNEVYESVEAATADGDSCLHAVAQAVLPQRTAFFPHELQSVRQGLALYSAAVKTLEELKQSTGSQATNLLDGISSPPKPGSTVKLLDGYLHLGEPVFTVEAVEGSKASLGGIDKTVNVEKVVLAADSVEVAFVDTALNGSWQSVEKEDAEMLSRLLDFAKHNGYAEALETGRKTGNFSGLAKALADKSSVFQTVIGIRSLLGAPEPTFQQGKKHRADKDISRKHRMFSAYEATRMTETLQVVLAHHALPGCLSLNHANLMMQPSLLLARLLERHTAGSPLVGPVNEEIADNQLTRAYVAPKATPMRDVQKQPGLGTQCLAGIYFELGLQAAGVETLSCHLRWKQEHNAKGRQGYNPASHTFSQVMRSACIVGPSKKSQAGLLPPGSLSDCDFTCLTKASLRKSWANKETEQNRRKYRLNSHFLKMGDALRMTTRYSYDEIVELDQKVAAAWLTGRHLLAASEKQTAKLEAGSVSRAENQALPSSTEEHYSRSSTTNLSQPTTELAETLAPSESESAALLQDGWKRLKNDSSQLETPETLRSFVTGGSINVNAMNLLSTANICKNLLTSELSNPTLFALSVLANLRGYINDSEAGLSSSKKQRKLAKGSDVFAALFRFLSCGLEGDLLPPLFAPFASAALQIGAFLRVELEESTALPWERVVQTMGDGVFTTKAYVKAVNHLRKKAASFIEKFTPCTAEVDDATDLLMLPQSSKRKTGLRKRLEKLSKKARGKKRRANREMCETSAELQQLARMLVVWWVLGPSPQISNEEASLQPSTTADTFSGARLVFASLLFNNGHDQAKIGMELIKAQCKMNKFDVPVGWAIGAKKGAAAPQQVTFKDISSDINASLMYLESQAGLRDIPDWVLPLKASQQFADACSRQKVVSLADLASTDAASMILMGYQCIKLQDEGVKLISSVFGKASTKVDKGYRHVLFQFLEGINAWRVSNGTSGLSQAFGKFASSSQEAEQQAALAEWNGDFPSVACNWKRSKRAQKAMVKKATKYRKPPTLPGKFAARPMEFHCPAHAPLQLQDLAKASQPEETQFCTGDSAQCAALDFSTELQTQL